MSEQRVDLIVFGATSFVGQILTRYLLETFGVGDSLNWAIAGRSEGKLQNLKTDLGMAAVDVPMIVADASDEDALKAMCSQTRAVVSTVGPYALYGEPLVRTCAALGTDYCDLTGEVQWIRQMIERYQEQARKSGARIVHCCGFDSIPSDMGVHFLQQQSMASYGEACRTVSMRVKAARGEFSGGTVASLMNVAREAAASPSLRKELANPFSLCPPGYKSSRRQPNVKSAEYDEDFRVWLAPFVMAAINTRIVHRTNALRDDAYGRDFAYDEAMMTGRGLKGRMAAYGITAAMGGFLVASAIRPSRWVLEQFVVPKPGEGPSANAQEEGFYDLRFIGKTADGRTLRTRVTGDRDPGYGSTGKMLGQAAACLALDIDKEAVAGGFWTPASIFGDRLIERLQMHAGVTFGLVD